MSRHEQGSQDGPGRLTIQRMNPMRRARARSSESSRTITARATGKLPALAWNIQKRKTGATAGTELERERPRKAGHNSRHPAS